MCYNILAKIGEEKVWPCLTPSQPKVGLRDVQCTSCNCGLWVNLLWHMKGPLLRCWGHSGSQKSKIEVKVASSEVCNAEKELRLRSEWASKSASQKTWLSYPDPGQENTKADKSEKFQTALNPQREKKILIFCSACRALKSVRMEPQRHDPWICSAWY